MYGTGTGRPLTGGHCQAQMDIQKAESWTMSMDDGHGGVCAWGGGTVTRGRRRAGYDPGRRGVVALALPVRGLPA